MIGPICCNDVFFVVSIYTSLQLHQLFFVSSAVTRYEWGLFDCHFDWKWSHLCALWLNGATDGITNILMVFINIELVRELIDDESLGHFNWIMFVLCSFCSLSVLSTVKQAIVTTFTYSFSLSIFCVPLWPLLLTFSSQIYIHAFEKTFFTHTLCF